MTMNANKEVLLLALESSYGVDAAPTAALNALRVTNTNFTPMDAEEKELEYKKESFGANKKIITRLNSKLSFDMYVAGSGTPGTPPPVGLPLQICAHSETIVPDTEVVYALVQEAIKSGTIYFWKDGILHKMTGCFGSYKVSYQAGELPKWTFDVQGNYVDPADTARPDNINWDSYIDPVAAIPLFTGDISVLGKQFKMKQFDLDGKRKIVQPKWVNAQETMISDATPDGSFEIEAPTLAEKDFFLAAKNAEEGELLYTHGNVPGNIVETRINRAALSRPEYGSNEDILTLKVNYTALHKDGNDDAVLTFK